MNNLKGASDQELIIEIYRRIKDEDESSRFKNYCYRAALRPIFNAFDKIDSDYANIQMYKAANWEKIEAERDEALTYFPE